MKLYGIAISVVPQKDNPRIFGVTCNPISVSDNDLEHFKPLDDLKFNTTFDSASMPSVMKCFVDIVNVMDEVVKRQEQSFNDAEYKPEECLPIALTIGQDSRNPTHFHALHMLLFGEKFSAAQPAAKAIAKERSSKLHPLLVKELGAEQIRLIEEFLRQSFEDIDQFVADEKTTWKNGIIEAGRIRIDYLAEHHHFPSEFIHASQRLAELLPKKCTLERGSFGKLPVDNKPNAVDLAINQLKEDFFQGNKRARKQLMKIAKKEGRKWGKNTTKTPSMFWHDAPAGYKTNQAQKDAMPRYDFFDWDPAFRKAFYAGFKETYIGPHNRHVKLPSDPSNPPFTDPCADMIRDQFEILAGRRSEDGVHDEPQWRGRIADSAQRQTER